MGTSNWDGGDVRTGVGAPEHPYDDEDCLRTLPLTARRPAAVGLDETMVVDLRRIGPDLEQTVVVNRPLVTLVANPRIAAAPAAGRGPGRASVPQNYAARPSTPSVPSTPSIPSAPRMPSAPSRAGRPSRPSLPAETIRMDLRYADAPRAEAVHERPFGPGAPGDVRGGQRTDDSEPPRRHVGRRVLLAAGGVTLLGGLGAFAAMRTMNTGSGRHLAAATVPQASTAGPSPSDLSSSPARSATPQPPANTTGPTTGPTANATGGATNSGVNPAQVQTKPEYYVQNGPKGIALTLDDGPTAEYTPQILALLQKYGIIATFCMIGEQIPPNASLVREVVAAGHTIVNHTWDHADQTKLSATKVRDSIARTSEALNNVGVTPQIFRAPYGSWNSTVFEACADAQLRPLDWSVDPQDWARPGASTIVQRILKQTRTGSIVLEHDGGGDRSQTVAALTTVLPELLNAGYRFGPV